MKKITIILAVFLGGVLFADDYRWNFINALSRNDFQIIENILKQNVNTMQDSEKRLLMNFLFNFSWGENAVRAMNILERYNISPRTFDLFTAINRNQPDIVIQSIIGKGVDPNGEILLLAMERQRFNLARQFIQMGVDVNYSYPLSSSHADGMTPLLYAVRWNNFELVKLLVEYEADINARDRNGNTAVSIARNNENTQMIVFLQEHGAVETFNAAAFDNNDEQTLRNAGISHFFENQVSALQTGTYQLLGSNMTIRFSGTANAGSVSYVINNRAGDGFYRAENGNLSLVMEGRTFSYRIDSNMSFSGNGEVWVRMGH